MTTQPPYTPERAARLVAAAPPHLAGEVARLIDMVNDTATRFAATGTWYHVSPHLVSPGTTLVPGGLDPANPTSKEFYVEDGYGDDTGTLADMGAGRSRFVWLTVSEEDARFWSRLLKAPHTYEVEPLDDPRPWNGTGSDGWVTTAARVVRKL